ncbi:ABC transporter ATP-binding protein [Frankia sp. AiPa1]|uniref:dipeptide ABC transporter ATP-binding protein n=1 Tax=Frankia sp. AiPa1 TaxID=573492 RepID=UPI00202B8FA8|nr:ABC transporter ATP-binding protein [Frankia sp. AiPa1]
MTVDQKNDQENDPLLAIRGLSVSYPGRPGPVLAVRGLDLDIHSGEIVALVGESGSGKSTTAHAVIGLLPPGGRIDAGSIQFGAHDLARLSHRELRVIRGAGIGLVPQDPAVSLNPVQRIGDQVAEVLRIHRLAGRGEAAAAAVDLLERAGLPEPRTRARQYPHELSGGMRQRALIAIAIAAKPRLIIADEPTSALDVTVQRLILDHLDQLTAELGTAVLLVTHDLGVAADRAQRIAVMSRGRIVETGPTARILDDPRDPYTRSLLRAAPSLSATRDLRPVVSARPAAALTKTVPSADSDAGKNGAQHGSRDGGQEAAALTPAAPAGTNGARPLVVADNLVKDFPLPRTAGGARTLRAVDEVSFTISPGETLALVGESGSGKSTTARLVLRLADPTGGRILFDGDDVTRAGGGRLRALRRRAQLIYQNPYASLDPRFTIDEVITEPLRVFHVGDRASRAARARDLLDRVALPASVLERRPAELSGGQRQRVAIARALALAPELVVCDEPVSALDVSVQAQVLELLGELQSDTGVAYLFISHDLSVVRQIAHRVAVMRSGRVVETGTTTELFAHPEHEYTRTLLDAIPGTAYAHHATPAPAPGPA